MSTDLSLAKSSATAIVKFTGLGVLTYNRRMKRAENLFIHAASHNLTVNIYKPLLPEETADPFLADQASIRRIDNNLYRQLATYSDLPPTQMDSMFNHINLSFDIFGEGNAQDECTFYRTPDFNRQTTTDLNDFGWMINVTQDGLIGGGPSGCSARKGVFPSTTKLFMRNAQFYTETLAKYEGADMEFRKVPIVGPSLALDLDQATTYGRAADKMGALIDAETVTVAVSVGDELHTHVLPRIHQAYMILIENVSEEPASDMEIYNQLWNTSGTATFDLMTVDEINRLRNPTQITGRDFCSGIYAECPETIGDFI